MKRNLLDLSGKIDQQIVDLCEAISLAAEKLEISFFLIGATAIDMVLHKGHDIPAKRATYDLDLGVEVPDWESFEQLKSALVDTEDFIQSPRQHQLKFRMEIDVDIVPFGEIEKEGSISWPPDNAIEMCVKGFTDAFCNSTSVLMRAKPPLVVLTANLASIATLKLLAWRDRHYDNPKDAIDLMTIVQNYLDAGNQERLHAEHHDLVNEEFDYEMTGARLLGRDIKATTKPGTVALLQAILEQETREGQSAHRLAEDMCPRGSGPEMTMKARNMLQSLRQGIED
jgi:predicted nucleotidyltransferase